MSTAQGYPVRLSGTPDVSLNRWLWLVKWLLLIPHYVVLLFLWIAFFLLTIVAFFAILFTRSYPRRIFEFNLGVLRWTWRVGFYSYSALGTDRYPPFTLGRAPDYPEHLSRGLVLVKSWLLVFPQYLVVGIFVGGWGHLLGPGLAGLLVLIAAIALAFSARYPRGIFDFVMGMNRWTLRVTAYAALMRDEYPPFRLDMGGEERGDLRPAEARADPPA